MKRVQVERTIEKQEKRTIEQEILWKSKKIETESEKRTSRSRATVKAEKRQIDRIIIKIKVTPKRVPNVLCHTAQRKKQIF